MHHSIPDAWKQPSVRTINVHPSFKISHRRNQAPSLPPGVGADDTFIFCKVWERCKSDKNAGTLAKLVGDSLRQAALSMLVTSLTTAAAFFSSCVSHVTAIACFRWAGHWGHWEGGKRGMDEARVRLILALGIDLDLEMLTNS